ANQKEALKSGYCVKEEPEAEEALSPARCPPFSLGHDAPTVPSRPRQEGSILSHDINVKVASELLMKLSDNQDLALWTTPRPLPDHSQTAPRPLPDLSQTSPRPLPDRSQTTPRPLPDLSQTAPRPLPDLSQTSPRPLPDRSQTAPRPLPDRSEEFSVYTL
ncbi:zinc finger protein 827 isoform X1, partial [Tachysurus ichikawai]